MLRTTTLIEKEPLKFSQQTCNDVIPTINRVSERKKYIAYQHDLGGILADTAGFFYLLEFYLNQIPELEELFSSAKLLSIHKNLNALAMLLTLSFSKSGKPVFYKLHNEKNPKQKLDQIKKDANLLEDIDHKILHFLKNLDAECTNQEIENYFNQLLTKLKNILVKILKKLSRIQLKDTQIKELEHYQILNKLITDLIPESIEIIDAVLLLFDPNAIETVLKTKKTVILSEVIQKSVERSNNYTIVEYQKPKRERKIATNKTAIMLALKNLINNAIKYSILEKKEQAKVGVSTLDRQN